ncbi:SNO-family glutamine amidotransferase, putative [Candida dubliniensis CD36]|uniref:Pyridoxal 5'-phosphate synthase glutaminase subunit n=1 Tax=Candida dubliniensis (strain CD36 / ATCC MYA-646 / CBS 7987 / NCPF 3949 / NRRL Y-17841) TaxID=573826 RepID=B9W743_CANDC|nr:SNO-family glutamine amidotransferase, putative [Candida dubliniensis CD36]CAX44502.1 SNO-family glutamine amidotransferase, putative [Candida dubliniensis CD36]
MTIERSVTIGVLALQGAFREHIAYFNHVIESNPDQYSEYDIRLKEVKTKQDLEQCDSLVIPGGESSSISYIAERTELLPHLYEFVSDKSKSIWGTCAGLIFLSKQLVNGIENQQILGALDIEVSRNAFGRQIDSFEQSLDFSSFIPGCTDFPTVFIRAPVVTKILIQRECLKEEVIRSNNSYQNPAPVKVLYSLKNYDGKDHELIVAVKQGHILGTSFHPELADDYRFHKWFLDEFVIKKLKQYTGRET